MEDIRDLKRQILELEDIVATQNLVFKVLVDDLCKIIFEGESTNIGRIITVDRLKLRLNYDKWLDKEE